MTTPMIYVRAYNNKRSIIFNYYIRIKLQTPMTSGFKQKIYISLSGETGHAFHIIAMVRKVCKETGQDFGSIEREMTAGDHDNMIDVVNEHFDCFVFMP